MGALLYRHICVASGIKCASVYGTAVHHVDKLVLGFLAFFSRLAQYIAKTPKVYGERRIAMCHNATLRETDVLE